MDSKEHRQFLAEIVTETNSLIGNKAAKGQQRFLANIAQFVAMTEKHEQAVDAARAAAVNPLNWLQCPDFFGENCNPLRNPDESEQLMCDYVLLAVLYDLGTDSTETKLYFKKPDNETGWFWYEWASGLYEAIAIIADNPKMEYDEGDKCRGRIMRAVKRVKADLAEPSACRTVQAAKVDNTHSADFTSVCWNGKKYQFNKTQAVCVGLLWEEWTKGGLTLSEKTIGEKIDSQNDGFRLLHVFRNHGGKGMHPAWGKMIVSQGKGIYGLAENSAKKSKSQNNHTSRTS